MVTPMLPSGAPDLESLDALVDHLIGRGVTGLLVLGSCGENGALSRDERLEVAARAVARVDERTHLMIGVPALGTREAVADAKVYAQMGADSLLGAADVRLPALRRRARPGTSALWPGPRARCRSSPTTFPAGSPWCWSRT